MRVIRAHDGVAFDFSSQHFAHIDRFSDLIHAVAHATALDPAQLILMSPAGSTLNDTLLAALLAAHRPPSPSRLSASPPDSSPRLPSDPPHLLYAFDRQHLAADPADVLSSLFSQLEHALEPPLPPFEPQPHTLSENATALAKAHHKTGLAHLRTTILLLSHVRAQKSALEAALNNLDKFRESPRGAWEAFETFAQPLVEEYGTLLEAYAPALALARRVKIHPALLSSSAAIHRPSSALGGSGSASATAVAKSKYMGDYVMEDRITQIKDRCLKVYEDLRTGFQCVRASSTEVDEGAMTFRNELGGPDCDLNDLDVLERDAEEGFQRIEQIVLQIPQLTSEEQEALAEAFAELLLLDEDSRERIAFLVERKNFWLHLIVTSLNRISVLQGIMSNMGSDVQALDTELRTRTDSFKHLARLKDFVTAYASTVVEVVRRREFARHLLDYAAALANSLSKLTSEERKRRLTYRVEYGGKMPFTVEGLDDINVPTIEFEMRNVSVGALGSTKAKDSSRSIQAPGDLPQLTRADVHDLIVSLRSIAESEEEARDEELVLARGPAKEVGLLVEKQFSRLESMENAFAQAVERIIITESQLVAAAPAPVADPQIVTQLQSQVEELRILNDTLRKQNEQEKVSTENSTRKFQSDIKLHLAKIEDLRLQLLQLKDESRDEREKLLSDRQSSTQERDDHLAEVKRLRSEVCTLDEDLKVRSKALQDVERQLASARATADDATKELHELEARHRDQLSDHGVALNQLQQYRERSSDLENQLRGALVDKKHKTELFESHQADAQRVKAEMQAEIEQLKANLEHQTNINCDANAKIEQQQSRIDEFETQAQKIEMTTRESEKAVRRLERVCKEAVGMLMAYQVTSRRITHRIDTMPKPGTSRKASSASATAVVVAGARAALTHSTAVATAAQPPAAGDGSIFVSTAEPVLPTQNVIMPEPTSSEFDSFFEELSKFNHENVAELVQNQLEILSCTVRKWMKDSHLYRLRASRAQELAHFRITFRQFAKGDLCLFLPTRNPMAKVWAAFHVSFPHYFLQANEVVAPIIKSREWLLARIVSLTEQVVDPKEPDTNPFALPAGTRYFLLEVEPWSVDKSPRRSAQSAAGSGQTSPAKKHSFSRSATLPSHMDLRMTSGGVNKRHSAGEASLGGEQPQDSPLLQSTSAAANAPPDAHLVTSAPSQAQPTQAASDLTQSEFTVIDRPPSPGAIDAGGDSPFASPFRTTPSRPSPNKVGPSALALSLAKSYPRSPLSHGSASAQPEAAELAEGGAVEKGPADSSQVPKEFKPSQSAQPAFLASMSSVSTHSRRTNISSAVAAPVKRGLRPVPKVYTASRPTSRTPSIASSSNVNPAMKKLLRPGSPSSKGFSTVSTSLVSSEKSLATAANTSNDAQTERANSASVAPMSILKPKDLAKRRVSVSGSAQPVMVYGTSGSSLGNSSIGGSGLFVNTRVEGQLSQSPSLNAAGQIGVSSQGPNVATSSNSSSIPVSGSGGGVGGAGGVGGGLSGSLFGTWRKRKESLGVLPASFGGASDLLKRFSSQNPSSPKS